MSYHIWHYIAHTPYLPTSLTLPRRAGPQSDNETPVWDPPIDREEESLEPRPLPPVSQDAEPCPQLQLPTNLENVKVKVTHVTSPGSFYVQLVHNNALLKWSVLQTRLLKEEPTPSHHL